MKRSSAILMPIFSLPSKYGIGTLGKEAYRFIDFLSDAKQSYWQILPVGPTSYGDSPYQSFSTFAGNPYFIDLDLLIKDGLLKRREVESINWGSREDKIDYSLIYENRFAVLYQAYRRGFERDREALTAFKRSNRWLADYALFMALKRYFGMKSWIEWEDEEIRLRKPQAVKKYQRLLKDDINFFTYLQFLFFTQWNRLKAYAAEKHIGIIGDVPIYVAMDSADVWANPKNFQLDEKNRQRQEFQHDFHHFEHQNFRLVDADFQRRNFVAEDYHARAQQNCDCHDLQHVAFRERRENVRRYERRQ